METHIDSLPQQKTWSDGLSDAKLLTLVIGPIAEPAAVSAGGLRGLFKCEAARLVSDSAFTSDQACKIKAIQELARRYFSERHTVGETVRCPQDTERLIAARLRDLPHEVFCCLYLDNRHRILGFETLFRGTIDGTSVYPREVVKQALGYNAAALIVAHNHPSGCAEPSQADEQITRRLRDALALIEVRLLDHLVVGDNDVTSLAGRGML